MIVPINFEHQHQQIRSHLIYNFSSVEDVILVTPVIEYPGIELFSSANFDLLYRKIGDTEWHLETRLKGKFPATVHSLNAQLENYFRDKSYRFTA